MCGIIGRIGTGNSVPYIIEGLSLLEYRGYDSAGVAVINNGKIDRVRSIGKLSNLKEKLGESTINGEICIGHTRWATHGKPSEENAHPHISFDRKFAVVHNGIIENARTVFDENFENEDILKSQTDTEVIAHLLAKFYDGDVLNSIKKVSSLLLGSFALGIICSDFPDMLFCTAMKSPLVAARNEDGSFISSDSNALSSFCHEYITVRQGEIAAITKEKITVYDKNLANVQKSVKKIANSKTDVGKGGYEHYMMREIMEQPDAVKKTLDSLFDGGRFSLTDLSIKPFFLKNELKRVCFIACGSAYHAGAVGAQIIEKLCRIQADCYVASEFRYGEPCIDETTLAIFISQSGETADTLAALRKAKSLGAKTLSIVNVKDSAIASETDDVLYTLAGAEISVATTKAYSAQLAVIYTIVLYIAKCRESLKEEKLQHLCEELLLLPKKLRSTIDAVKDRSKALAEKLYRHNDIYYIGRQISYAVALEGSLKMKEISYIHSECYAAGELKHGTISLIDEGTPVIAVAHNSKIFLKTASNLSEVKARGAFTVLITDREDLSDIKDVDEVVSVPKISSQFSASLLVIPCQLISYYTARLRGCDIDKPKNLAKSVTVE